MTPLPASVQPGTAAGSGIRRGPLRRWLPTVTAVLVMALTAQAGRWQMHRAQAKALLQVQLEARLQAPPVDLVALAGAARDPRSGAGPAAESAATGAPPGMPDPDALRFRRARARGQFLAAAQIYIDNRDQGGRSGYHVLTPLDLGAKVVVLVNRGFLARDASYPRAPQVAVPEGGQALEGQLSLARSRFLELSQDTVNGAVWQNLKVEQYAARTGLHVLPWVLLADPAGPGLEAVHEQPDANIAMHRGYMVQWFALCAATGALWLWYTFIRRNPDPS